MSNQQITERAQQLLKTLVECYIREGQPVGSSKLVRESNLELSSATVRNVIADLERLGLVHSLHTSSGRIPTVKGYRLFIDNLLTVKQLNINEVNFLKGQLSSETDTHELIESTSNMLSGITKMAGIVMLPARDQVSLRQVEFVALSDRRVLVILVFNDEDVQNRIIHTSRRYDQAELQNIANFLNSEFIGKNVEMVRKKILNEMRETKDSMNNIMLNAIELSQHVFEAEDNPPSHDYVLAGETNLMKYEEMADISRLRQLFEAFNEKRSILQLLDQSLHAPGVQIFIGNESGYEALDDCSVITTTYSDGQGTVGALGIIGPTRMAYDRVIPIVDVTANLLGTVLKQRH